MKRVPTLVPLFVVVLLTVATSGLDMESAREQPCFDITETAPIDINWLTTINTIYYPAMSRLELYRIASDLHLKDPKDIMESSLYYDSCITWNIYSNGSIISRGFDGLSRPYTTMPVKPPLEEFKFRPVEGMGYSGTVYTTLTDNKTFLFTPFCTDEGEMAWGLGSLLPSLPAETIKLAYDHAESLGFKREYFTELRYDRCDTETVEEATTVVEQEDVSTTTGANFHGWTG